MALPLRCGVMVTNIGSCSTSSGGSTSSGVSTSSGGSSTSNSRSSCCSSTSIKYSIVLRQLGGVVTKAKPVPHLV